MLKTRNDWLRAAQLYLSSLGVYAAFLLIVRMTPYFREWMLPNAQLALLWVYLVYAAAAPVYYLLNADGSSTNKPLLALRYLGRLLARRGAPPFGRPTPEEKTALLFLLVKFFYAPIMANFFVRNATGLCAVIAFPPESGVLAEWYSVALMTLVTTDTLIFFTGYICEFRKLDNMVRSVEPTLFGWLVAVMCYPPFATWVAGVVGWAADDFVVFWTPFWTQVFRAVLILLFVIYVWASVALGFKAANLCHRGIVDRFPYSVIRHPAYISKNLFWWITLLPVLSVRGVACMVFWSLVYYFRAETEEAHLSKDPVYVEYCKRVPYKFIPGLW